MFETDFFKFVTNEGCDIGQLNDNENHTIMRGYFYKLEDNYNIWDDFDKEYILFKKIEG